jgi:hypothetical protein
VWYQQVREVELGGNDRFLMLMTQGLPFLVDKVNARLALTGIGKV